MRHCTQGPFLENQILLYYLFIIVGKSEDTNKFKYLRTTLTNVWRDNMSIFEEKKTYTLKLEFLHRKGSINNLKQIHHETWIFREVT